MFHFLSDIRTELSNHEVFLLDMVINHALLLLKKKFPDGSNLEDTELEICKKI